MLYIHMQLWGWVCTVLLTPAYHKGVSYNCISLGRWSMTLILNSLTHILMSFAEYPQKLYLGNISGSFSSAELRKQRLKKVHLTLQRGRAIRVPLYSLSSLLRYNTANCPRYSSILTEIKKNFTNYLGRLQAEAFTFPRKLCDSDNTTAGKLIDFLTPAPKGDS